jgi:two-component system LytT family response regulator
VNRIRTLVVDDEPLARRGVVQMLAAHRDVDVVSEARSASTALEAVRSLSPDLMFLDIQMPVADGFDLLGKLEASTPLIVFVTAYDAFAVRAYETSAIDYLLKPLQPARFALTMQRVRERLRERAASTPSGTAPPERLIVPGMDGLTVLNLAEIDLIEADDYYAAIHARGRRFLIREALSALERRLAAHGFVRVHRSAIVPLAKVVELHRESGTGTGALLLRSGARVTVSRRRMAGVEEALRGPR